MSFNLLVFIKQVPDTQNISGDAMTPEGTVNRAALPAIFNPEDLNALEMALQLKDRYGVNVTVATMGMPSAKAQEASSPTFPFVADSVKATRRGRFHQILFGLSPTAQKS